MILSALGFFMIMAGTFGCGFYAARIGFTKRAKDEYMRGWKDAMELRDGWEHSRMLEELPVTQETRVH